MSISGQKNKINIIKQKSIWVFNSKNIQLVPFTLNKCYYKWAVVEECCRCCKTLSRTGCTVAFVCSREHIHQQHNYRFLIDHRIWEIIKIECSWMDCPVRKSVFPAVVSHCIRIRCCFWYIDRKREMLSRAKTLLRWCSKRWSVRNSSSSLKFFMCKVSLKNVSQVGDFSVMTNAPWNCSIYTGGMSNGVFS